MLAESGKHHRRKPCFVVSPAETKEEKEILEHTSSLAIAIAVTVTLIVVGVLGLRKRHFL